MLLASPEIFWSLEICIHFTVLKFMYCEFLLRIIHQTPLKSDEFNNISCKTDF